MASWVIARLRWHWLIRRSVEFRDSIWFWPAVMSLGALGLFWLTTWLDNQDSLIAAMDALPAWTNMLLFSGDTEAARGLLGTVAGMCATILGISFSVTLVTVQLTATKYITPVMPHFERDRVTQVVMGTYLATVIYALLVLRTIRLEEPAFVPTIGVNLTMVLAVVALFMLILFVSNVIEFVRPGAFLRSTLADARTAVATMNEAEDKPWLTADRARCKPSLMPEAAIPIVARVEGLLTSRVWDDMLACAQVELGKHRGAGLTWTLYLHHHLGEEVQRGDPLAHLLLPPGAGDPELLVAWVNWAHDLGGLRQRNIDVDYGIETLAGMTVKGTTQGDLDVTFQGVDCMMALLPILAREPEPAECMILEAAGNRLVIYKEPVDLFGKLMRELTLVSEVALASSLPFRQVTEGLSQRFAEMLIAMLQRDDFDTFFRVVRHLRPWYETSYYHMGWIHGLRHLTNNLVEVAAVAAADGHPGTFEAILELMVSMRDEAAPGGMTHQALSEGLVAIAHRVDLPSLSISLVDDIRRAAERREEP